VLNDGDQLQYGSFTVQTLYTPDHIPACCTYQIGDALFTGDALFMPDIGVAHCDFPDGSPQLLYHSVKNRPYRFPHQTRVFAGHDYPNAGELRYQTTIGASKATECRSARQH
jgi:glyoxylase-like metal-dependent hydrolase (beta-lactamase superfamily II)